MPSPQLLELERDSPTSSALVEAAEGLELSLDELLDDAAPSHGYAHSPASAPAPSHDPTYAEDRRRKEIYKHTDYYAALKDRVRAAMHLGHLIETGRAHVCEKCGEIVKQGEWPFCDPARAHLNDGTNHGRVLPRNAATSAATAYYINPLTKKIWIPGRNSGARPLDRRGRPIKGYVRREVSYSERKGFYRLLDQQAKDTYFRRIEREEKTFGPMFSENRKQLRIDCKNREWIEQSIAKTEAAQHAKLKYEPGSHVEAWEWDRASTNDLEGANYKKMLETLNERQPENFKPKIAGKGESPRAKERALERADARRARAKGKRA